MASRSSSCRTESVSFQGVRSHRKSWFRSRLLDDRRWVVVYIDRFGLGDQTMVGALGVDAQGNKMPPSVMQGSTENRTVRQRPLNNDPDTIGPYFGPTHYERRLPCAASTETSLFERAPSLAVDPMPALTGTCYHVS